MEQMPGESFTTGKKTYLHKYESVGRGSISGRVVYKRITEDGESNDTAVDYCYSDGSPYKWVDYRNFNNQFIVI